MNSPFLMRLLSFVAVAALCSSCRHPGSSPSDAVNPGAAAPFVDRIQKFIPEATGVSVAEATRLAPAHYIRDGTGLSSEDLYLLPDGTCYWGEQSDLPSLSGRRYSIGRWTVRNGLVELERKFQSREKIFDAGNPAFFFLRLKLNGKERVFLLGTGPDIERYLVSAVNSQAAGIADGDTPEARAHVHAYLRTTLLRYRSARREETISAGEAARVKQSLDDANREEAEASKLLHPVQTPSPVPPAKGG